MDKPTHSNPAPAASTPVDNNYISPAGPPPAYPPNETGHEMPKYGGPTSDPSYNQQQQQQGGGYFPPQQQQQQQQQPFAGGPQNYAPYGTPLPSLGPHPAPIECPECRARGVTAVEYTSGGFTHALGALVCFVSCLGCIPYFFSSLKDARHKCSKCGIPLATFHRSGRTEVHWHQAYNG